MSAADETSSSDPELAVRRRYSEAAKKPEPGLCCSVRSDPRLLVAIPSEVLERNYGCGDPAPHVAEGDVVIDLGSGAGKSCFIASQIVGPTGRVVGIDMNDDMLALARRSASEVGRRLGYSNVDFKKGRIQDLALDLEALGKTLEERPVSSVEELARLESIEEWLREARPLVPSGAVDVVISNCVLNLVRSRDKSLLFREIFRVLKPGGRAVISDIVSDRHVPESMRKDPELLSGCVSGAWREDEFIQAFEDAGFHGVTLLDRQIDPWQVVEGIEFRSVTVIAQKGEDGPCHYLGSEVIYRGPFREVTDDEGHVLRRGARVAVCEKTLRAYSRGEYRCHFEFVPPRATQGCESPPSTTIPSSCRAAAPRRDFLSNSSNSSNPGETGCCSS